LILNQNSSTSWTANSQLITGLKVKVMLWPMISQPVCLGVRHTSVRQINVNVLMVGALWWEDRFVVYKSCLTLPTQSFVCPSPTGLMTITYCLKFEGQVSVFISPGAGQPSYTPRYSMTGLSCLFPLYSFGKDRRVKANSKKSSVTGWCFKRANA
jgi:hypothetical protein